MLDICLLGTGGVVPLPDRWLTSLLIRYNGRMILIDCGEGTQIPINMTKWGLKALDTILITHYHADHIAGLPGLLLTLGNSGRAEPVNIIGPLGLTEVIKGLTVISPELPYKINIIEINDGFHESFNDVIIKSITVDHTITCVAYSIEIKRQGKFNSAIAKELNIPIEKWKYLQKGETIEIDKRIYTPDMVIGDARKGIKVCYSTDTRPTNNLVNFINDSDLFICEGMYGDDENLNNAITKKHMLFSEAAQLAKSGNVKELWLTHYSPSLREPELYIDFAKSIFENTNIGKDLMIKSLKFEE